MAQDTGRKIKTPKKLIEVALPLDAINRAAAREKSIRHGHPATLHLWWARRPLAAARAVLFAQLVNDPGGDRGWGKYKGQTKEDAERERRRLFDLIEQLVQWENTNNEEILEQAREEIHKSWRETCEMNKGVRGFEPNKLPPFHDPFAGGGTIPLEAQRLGLEAHASDLNPVAVLINKAMIEIPPRFAGQTPVGPSIPGEKQTKAKATSRWAGTLGLAEDVRRYGHRLRSEALKKLESLYPPMTITKELAAGRKDLVSHIGAELPVIAWLWARTVPSPDPALGGVHVPLTSSFWLGTKKGKRAWLEPIISGTKYEFRVRTDAPPEPKQVDQGTKIGRAGGFRCLLSGSVISFDHIRDQGRLGRLQQRLMAVVVQAERGRLYVSPTKLHSSVAERSAPSPSGAPTTDLPDQALGFRVQRYGLTRHSDLFTKRQLLLLSTMAELLPGIRDQVEVAASECGIVGDARRLVQGGAGPAAYADAVACYIALHR